MTNTDEPATTASEAPEVLTAEQRLAEIRADVGEDWAWTYVPELLAEIDRLTAAGTDPSAERALKTSAEAYRIVNEAKEMRAERDAWRARYLAETEGVIVEPLADVMAEIDRLRAALAASEESVAYLERQSAGRLKLLEDVDATKQFLEGERNRLDTALAASEQRAARLAEAGEALYIELQDAAFGYEGVHWKVQRDAPPVLAAWRALLPGPPREDGR